MSEQASITVRIAPTNPGQFLACCGLLELADRLSAGGAEAWFANGQFHVAAAVRLEEVLSALVAHAPEPQLELPGGLAVKPLIAPLRLTLDAERDVHLTLDSWMQLRRGTQVEATGRPPWNFWSGQQTTANIWAPLRAALQAQLREDPAVVSEAVFERHKPLSGRFGFDPGAAWNALDVGFSCNEQRMTVASSPAVEMLAAVGLLRCTPVVAAGSMRIRYWTWGKPLPPPVAAAAASGRIVVPPSRAYSAPVVSRGQYGALGHAKLEEGTNDE